MGNEIGSDIDSDAVLRDCDETRRGRLGNVRARPFRDALTELWRDPNITSHLLRIRAGKMLDVKSFRFFLGFGRPGKTGLEHASRADESVWAPTLASWCE